MTEARAFVSEGFNTTAGNWFSGDPLDLVVRGVQIMRPFEGGQAIPSPTGISVPTEST